MYFHIECSLEWRLTLLHGTRSNLCGFCYVNMCGGDVGIHVGIRVCACVCVCVCTCICAWVYVRMHMCMGVCVYV